MSRPERPAGTDSVSASTSMCQSRQRASTGSSVNARRASLRFSAVRVFAALIPRPPAGLRRSGSMADIRSSPAHSRTVSRTASRNRGRSAVAGSPCARRPSTRWNAVAATIAATSARVARHTTA